MMFVDGFKDADRGKLIMACGTGKTFTALRIAEEIAGVGGRVLYLVPSIGLFSQAMREWAEQQGVSHRYIGICSDTKAGKMHEDASILELEIPVTTDATAISDALQKTDENNMKVVFCTYHSLPIVEAAQNVGAPPFDIFSVMKHTEQPALNILMMRPLRSFSSMIRSGFVLKNAST